MRLDFGPDAHCVTALQVEKLLKAHGFRNTSQLLEAVNESSDRLQAFYEAEEHQVGPQGEEGGGGDSL